MDAGADIGEEECNPRSMIKSSMEHSPLGSTMSAMRIALATCAALPEWEVDDLPLHLALKQHGVEVDHPVWTDESVDWSTFDAWGLDCGSDGSGWWLDRDSDARSP